jgi:hypothetical protein
MMINIDLGLPKQPKWWLSFVKKYNELPLDEDALWFLIIRSQERLRGLQKLRSESVGVVDSKRLTVSDTAISTAEKTCPKCRNKIVSADGYCYMCNYKED